jgi:hypothetical protein
MHLNNRLDFLAALHLGQARDAPTASKPEENTALIHCINLCVTTSSDPS